MSDEERPSGGKKDYSFLVEEHVLRVKRCVVVASSKEEAKKKAIEGECVFEYIEPDGPGSVLMDRILIES